jgi:hypothetical protein
LKHLIAASHGRLILVLASLASLAVVIEAGHRW